MAPICIYISEQLGIQLVFESIHFCESPDSFESIQRMLCHIPFITPGSSLIKSLFPKWLLVPQIVQRMSLPENNSSVTLPIHKVSHVWVSFITSNQVLFLVLCHWCGNHRVPPVTSLFLLTSAHYPGIRPRNLVKYLEAFMPQWQVSSLSIVGFHQWALIERFYQVFEFKTSMYTWQIVLRYLGNHWH